MKDSKFENLQKKNILILGGSGYIGSRIRQVLSVSYLVDSIDIVESTDYHDLEEEELVKYNVIVLLAGHSSVKSCIGDIAGPWLNNVTNFTNLISKIAPDTLVIYASSSSVYGNSMTGKKHIEGNLEFIPVNNYDLTKYTLDLSAQLAISQGYNIIGLRFGTVNGWSPKLRTDLMINAMYDSAINENQIKVNNKHINRAILGIEDLCNAVTKCIEKPTVGIYNLSSFNTTVDEISKILSKRLAVPIVDLGEFDGVYDFALDCSKFKKIFEFTFNETPETIVDGLIERYNESTYIKRDKYIKYEWKQKNEKL